MSCIKVYKNIKTNDYTKVQIHYQFYIYHFLPYVLWSDLEAIDRHAVGLCVLDKQYEKYALSSYSDRIYLRQVDNIPPEDAIYVLNISNDRSEGEEAMEQIEQNELDISYCSNLHVSLGHYCYVSSTANPEKEQLNVIRKRKRNS